MKKESSEAGAMLIKIKSSGAGAWAMLMIRKHSVDGAVSFSPRLSSLGAKQT